METEILEIVRNRGKGSEYYKGFIQEYVEQKVRT